ncbi:hypothetical protein COLO4_01819, partial [Corchorus olitorius]
REAVSVPGPSSRRPALGARHVVPLGGALGDQSRQVVELGRVPVDEAEVDLHPLAGRRRFHRAEGMQIAIEARHVIAVFALLQVEHGGFQDLRQRIATAHHQQGFLDADGLDQTGHAGVGQAQLALTEVGGGLATGGWRRRAAGEQGGTGGGSRRRDRCGGGLDHVTAAGGQGTEGIIGEAGGRARLGAGLQLGELAGALQGLLDLGRQLFVGERLAHVVGHAGLDGLDDVFLVAAAGDHDEGHALVVRLGAKPAQQFQTGHAGHFPVAEDEVEALLAEHRLGAATIGRLVHRQPGKQVAQALLDQIANEGRVIHH